MCFKLQYDSPEGIQKYLEWGGNFRKSVQFLMMTTFHLYGIFVKPSLCDFKVDCMWYIIQDRQFFIILASDSTNMYLMSVMCQTQHPLLPCSLSYDIFLSNQCHIFKITQVLEPSHLGYPSRLCHLLTTGLCHYLIKYLNLSFSI